MCARVIANDVPPLKQLAMTCSNGMFKTPCDMLAHSLWENEPCQLSLGAHSIQNQKMYQLRAEVLTT